MRLPLACILIFLCVALFYSPTSNFAFVRWDDGIQILHNPLLRDLSLHGIWGLFTNIEYAMRYEPMNWLSLALTYRAVGVSSAFYYHLTNVLVHALNAAMACWVLFLLLRKHMPDSESAKWQLLCASFGAVFWALHPLRVEAVAWCTSRTYLLSTFFALLSVVALFHRRSIVAVGGSIVAFITSLLFYVPAICLPLAVLCVDPPWRRERRRLLPESTSKSLPFLFLASLAVGALTLLSRAQHYSTFWPAPPSLADLGWRMRLAQALYSWSHYLRKEIWPVRLSIIYTEGFELASATPWIIFSITAVLGLSLILWGKRKRWRAPWLLWCAYFLLLLPALGLTEKNFIPSDRYTYFPSLVWGFAMAALFAKMGAASGQRRAIGGAMMAALCLAVAMPAFPQMYVWRNSETLFRDTLESLGSHWYQIDIRWRLAEDLHGQGRMVEALEEVNRALEIDPNYAPALAIKKRIVREAQ